MEVTDVTQKWWDEKYDYIWDDNKVGACTGRACGHYTQMAWSDSDRLGCGVSWCEPVQNFGHSGFIVFCNYGPA